MVAKENQFSWKNLPEKFENKSAPILPVKIDEDLRKY
jgi:hypothetical protein